MSRRRQPSPAYVLSDRKNNVLARGTVESPPGAEQIYVRVPEEQILELSRHELIQLVAVSRDLPCLLGRVTGYRRDILILAPAEEMAGNIRQHLRVNIRFDTYLYPLTGPWRGRRYVVSHDISSGGVAFYSKEPLAAGEQAEIVIPITAQPLVLRCEVLRELPCQEEGLRLYACRFIHMCDDEETFLREGVFSAQLRAR